MIDLVARQVKILRAVIEEFIETAEPVGSATVDKKYNIGVSPATIRNEMVYLTKQGYLTKAHRSAGRVPTPLALKLYINELMKEKDLSVADEVSAKEKIWNSRNRLEDLLRSSTKVLADKTRALGLAMTEEEKIYHSGYANLLEMPEFFDIKVTRSVLRLIEQARALEEIFSYGESEDQVQVVFGEELGNQKLDPIGLVYINVRAKNQSCWIGVMGSSRFDFQFTIPLMKYFKSLIEEMT